MRSTRRWLQARAPVEQAGKLASNHSGSGQWSAARICVAMVLIACVSACADSIRVYEGERRSSDEVAILTDSGCGTVVLVAVDKHDRMKSAKVPHRWSSYTAQVLPGRHWVTVKWIASWGQEFSGAVLATDVAIALLTFYGPSSFNAVSGKKWVPASTGSIQFSFYAKAGHKYRIREIKGPDRQASNAVQQCWQYLGIVAVEREDSINLWLVDETRLRAASSGP